MQLTVFASLLVSTAIAAPQQKTAWVPGSTTGVDLLAEQALSKLSTAYAENSTLVTGSATSTCTLENASQRKEWDTLEPTEKKEYIKAVLCLQALPDISGDLAPGARTRYDDFVVSHLNQTATIHSTGNFLSWHRYFVWNYEQALRNECNYTGYRMYHRQSSCSLASLSLSPKQKLTFEKRTLCELGTLYKRCHQRSPLRRLRYLHLRKRRLPRAHPNSPDNPKGRRNQHDHPSKRRRRLRTQRALCELHHQHRAPRNQRLKSQPSLFRSRL